MVWKQSGLVLCEVLMRTFNLPVLLCATLESISAETTYIAYICCTHLCGSNPMKKTERKKTGQLIKEKASNQMFLLQNLWSETYSRQKKPEKNCWETHVTSYYKHTPTTQTHADSQSRAAESSSTRGLPEDTPDWQQHRAEHPVSTRGTRERHLRLSLPHVPV